MGRTLSLLAIAGVVATSAPLAGCFVFDELEAGEKIMDQHAPKKPGDTAVAPAGAKTGEDAEEARPTGQAWWAQARSLNRAPEEAEAADPDAVVRCELGGSTRFMRQGDCLSQGGRPAGR